jgi:peptidoglycan/LPS O-acetylase OafA/YrhL
MAFHYEALFTFAPTSIWPSADSLQLHLGLMGVELFFVISGFVMLLTLERTSTLTIFVIARIARLYPCYIASVFVVVIYLLPYGGVNISQVVINCTMLQSFFKAPNLIPPYWTLAYELWFYAVLATIYFVGLATYLDRLSLAWLTLATLTRILGIDLSMGRIGIVTMQQFGHLFISGVIIYRLISLRFTYLDFFVLIGCVIYSAFGRHDWANVTGFSYCLVNACSIIAVLGAAKFPALQFKMLRTVGLSSYSLYLFHLPIGMILAGIADHLHQPRWAAVLLSVPCSLVAAACLWRWVEKPGQNYTQAALESLVSRITGRGLARRSN